MNIYKRWILNAPIKKKFLPVQTITFSLIVAIGVMSMIALSTVNRVSQNVLSENVEDIEKLNEIIRTMYACRVNGRDILLASSLERQYEIYGQYVYNFYLLDLRMDSFSERLTGEKLQTFLSIIEEKNVYKDSMLLSADIEMEGGSYEDALEALTRVTPIANSFFTSLDTFLTDEKIYMNSVLQDNDKIVTSLYIISIVVYVLSAFIVLVLVRSFSKTLVNTLGSLEHSVSEISQTGNMKTPIPENLFTKDEVGRIALVVDRLRSMLLNYSFKDSLTGGFNTTAYHEELWEIFRNKKSGPVSKDFWCMICDMNNLKKVNDALGHQAGNEALNKSYAILMNCFSEYGKIFRIGGDEFALLLWNCTEAQIEEGVNTMQKSVEEATKDMSPKFSLAWGYAKFSGTTLEEYNTLFEEVDKKMYEKKAELKRKL